MHENKIKEVRVRLGFGGAFAVDKIGRSGGLTCMSKLPFDCSLINYSTNFINMEGTHQHHQQWRFTGLYGYPEIERRQDSWDML